MDKNQLLINKLSKQEGWAIASQAESILLDGDPIEDQNSHALEIILGYAKQLKMHDLVSQITEYLGQPNDIDLDDDYAEFDNEAFVEHVEKNHGWAIATQAENILNGESLDDQNSNALQIIAQEAAKFEEFEWVKDEIESYLNEFTESDHYFENIMTKFNKIDENKSTISRINPIKNELGSYKSILERTDPLETPVIIKEEWNEPFGFIKSLNKETLSEDFHSSTLTFLHKIYLGDHGVRGCIYVHHSSPDMEMVNKLEQDGLVSTNDTGKFIAVSLTDKGINALGVGAELD